MCWRRSSNLQPYQGREAKGPKQPRQIPAPESRRGRVASSHAGAACVRSPRAIAVSRRPVRLGPPSFSAHDSGALSEFGRGAQRVLKAHALCRSGSRPWSSNSLSSARMRGDWTGRGERRKSAGQPNSPARLSARRGIAWQTDKAAKIAATATIQGVSRSRAARLSATFAGWPSASVFRIASSKPDCPRPSIRPQGQRVSRGRRLAQFPGQRSARHPTLLRPLESHRPQEGVRDERRTRAVAAQG